jgi:hypothetical protein
LKENHEIINNDTNNRTWEKMKKTITLLTKSSRSCSAFHSNFLLSRPLQLLLQTLHWVWPGCWDQRAILAAAGRSPPVKSAPERRGCFDAVELYLHPAVEGWDHTGLPARPL